MCNNLPVWIMEQDTTIFLQIHNAPQQQKNEPNVTGMRKTKHWQVIDNPSIFHEECLVNTGCMQQQTYKVTSVVSNPLLRARF